MKKTLYISLFLLLTCIIGKAQTPDFSQVTLNLLYTNPAFAGTKSCPRFISGYRNKFVTLGNAYQTYYATYDQYYDNFKGNIGVTFLNDIQSKGVIKNTMIGLIYAKDISISSEYILKLAIEADYLQHTINTQKVSYPDMIDPVYGFIYPTAESSIFERYHKANVSAGILAFSEKQYLGISMFNINQPTSSLSKKNSLLSRKISIQYAYNIMYRPTQKPLKDAYFFLPNIVIFNQGKSTQIHYGLNMTKNFLLTGIGIKQNIGTNFDTFSFIVGFIQKKFKFAYNCDMSLVKVSNSFLDCHELSLTYFFNCVEKKKINKAINCPGI